MLEMFITIIAVIGLLLSAIRITGIAIGYEQNKRRILFAESLGFNPLWEALRLPLLTLVLSLSWLISYSIN